jgi:hypothetical protein
MSLSALYRSARSLEAIENFVIATQRRFFNRTSPSGLYRGHSESSIMQNPPIPFRSTTRSDYLYITSDTDFWNTILSRFQGMYSHQVHFADFGLSEWIARVPGLYWTTRATVLRDKAEAAIEFTSEEWKVYIPLGKSQIVSGGIGTIKLPPDNAGNRLVTLSAGFNASSGIPALISAEVWKHHKLCEGVVLSGQAEWWKMHDGWSNRFPSIRGIPKGYLLIKNIDQISVRARQQPTQFHPSTVMEYYTGDALLYDFVFATADTGISNYRRKLEQFFKDYKNSNERYGNYLLPADINDPLFDAEFPEPDELKRTVSGKSQLQLLEERIRQHSYRGRTLDELVQIMAENCDNSDLRAICRDIGLPRSLLADVAASSVVNVLNACVQMNKVEELIDALAQHNMGLFL